MKIRDRKPRLLHCTVPGSTSTLDQVPKTVPAVSLILILLLIKMKFSEPEQAAAHFRTRLGWTYTLHQFVP